MWGVGSTKKKQNIGTAFNFLIKALWCTGSSYHLNREGESLQQYIKYIVFFVQLSDHLN